MTKKFLNYIKSLAEQHKDFNHGKDGVRAYFEFDYPAMSEARRRGKYVIFVDKLRGLLTDNRADYRTDTQEVTVLFLTQMESKNIALAREYFLDCKDRYEEFLARMMHDRRHGGDEVCELLEHFDLNKVSWEFAPITADLFTGVQVRFPFRTELNITYDVTLWRSSTP